LHNLANPLSDAEGKTNAVELTILKLLQLAELQT